MVKKFSYKNDGNKNISNHFKFKEFASSDGKKLYSDDILIDTDIIEILEKLFIRMNAYKLIITSGYRTTEHEMTLSNSAVNGYHTKGQAVDINVWKNSNERYSSKEIALALEDLGWNHGIGLVTKTAVHIDSRPSKYYFDESNHNKSIGNSFYTFYKVQKVDYIANVKKRFDFTNETMEYLLKYLYKDDLIYKLATKK